jgi:condensin complex subunit 2
MLGSKDFLTLFMKPGSMIKIKRKATYHHIDNDEDADEQEQPNQEALFWAENDVQTADAPVDLGDGGFGGDDIMNAPDSDSDGEEHGPILSSQPESDWKSQLVSQPKTTKAQFLNYARVAKKVDVKLLKENLWKNLTVLSSGKQKVEKPIEFKNVMTSLDEEYPEKKRKDISVAFCFICLLHLANENELEIVPTAEGNSDMPLEEGVNTDLLIKQR